MTDQDQKVPLRLPVTAAPGSRLEQLLASYEGARAAAEEAKGRFEALTAAIKAELSGASPGVAAFTLTGAPGLPRLSVTWHQGAWRLDAARMKEEDPVTYVRYARQGKGYWECKAL